MSPNEPSKCSFCGANLISVGAATSCPACLLSLAAPTPGSKPVVSELSRISYFGDYELLAELARGGMGVVCRARQVSLNRTVALKMIAAGQLATPALVQRFHTEAEAAARLEHPNIVPIYEIGQHDGQHYFSMKLVEGGTLAGRMDGAMPVRTAAAILIKTARAVHYAHQRGVLHRDLKPGNVLLDAAGEPFVTDFGLAKLLADDSTQTRTEAILGTPGFLPPEQAAGRNREVTIAADIYGLGAILYGLLTGEPPFRGESAVETLRKVCETEPRKIRTRRPDVPPDLETICLKCLAKQPGARYASGEELACDLERWLNGEPILARPVSPAEKFWSWCRRHPAVATLSAVTLLLLIVVAVGSTIAAIRIQREHQAAHRAEQQATEELWHSLQAQARALRLSGQPGRRQESLAAILRAASIRPSLELRCEAIAALALLDLRSGKNFGPTNLPHELLCFDRDLARYAFVDSTGHISIRRVGDDSEIVRLGDDARPVNWLRDWSPDGRFLEAMIGEESVRVYDLQTIRPVFATNTWGSFTPDSRQYWYPDGRGNAVAFDLIDGHSEVRLNVGWKDFSLIFSPRGNEVATWRGTNIQVWNLAGGAPAIRITAPGIVDQLAYSPDGRKLVGGCFDRQAYVWDKQSGEAILALRGHEARVTRVGFSRVGDLIATTGWDDTVRIWDAASGHQLLQTRGGTYQLQFGRGDRWLAARRRSGQPFEWLEIVRDESFRSFELNPDARVGEHWDISSDGRSAVLARVSGLSYSVVDLETGREVRRLPEHLFTEPLPPNRTFEVAFGPGGESVFAATHAGLLCYELTPAADSSPTNPPAQLIYPGKFISSVHRSGNSLLVSEESLDRLLLFNLHESRARPAVIPFPRAASASLSPDGRTLAAYVWRSDVISLLDTNGSVLTNLPARRPGRPFFSPDGQWLICAGESYQSWRTADWSPGPPLSVAEPNVISGWVAFTPDSRNVALLVGNHALELHRFPSGELIARFETPEHGQLAEPHFSAEGTRLYALAPGHGYVVWNLQKLRDELRSMRLDWD